MKGYYNFYKKLTQSTQHKTIFFLSHNFYISEKFTPKTKANMFLKIRLNRFKILNCYIDATVFVFHCHKNVLSYYLYNIFTLVWLYGISTLVGLFKTNSSLHMYIKYMIWFGWFFFTYQPL